MKTIEEQIDDLREQIHALETQRRDEHRTEILPFLKEHGRLIWDGYGGRMEVKFATVALETTAIQMIERAEGTCGGYHMRVELTEDMALCYDDGKITVSFTIRGLTSELTDKIFKKVTTLGLTLVFDDAIREAKGEVAKETNKLNKLLKLQEQYLQSKAT